MFLQEPDNKYSSKCVRISSVTDCYELKCILKEKFSLHRDLNPHRLNVYEVHLDQRKLIARYKFKFFVLLLGTVTKI